MIYEIEIVRLAPRGWGEYAKEFARVFRKHDLGASLLGLFQADIGLLNRAMLVWAHEDGDQQARVRRALTNCCEVEGSTSRMYRTVPLLPRPLVGSWGGVYEVRTYQGHPGRMDDAVRAWEKHLPPRLKLSPCVALFFSEPAPDGSWEYVHFWPYRDLNHRAEVRGRAHEAGWPPGAIDYARGILKSQQSEIWLPAPFSPMH